ncbi:BA75_02574T0 [Komagataella pastoris]|uniref:BA75_02574T0 n=1 Tax=Komagataella pastoris TaxID=4922 RepID=A0A1B2JDD8_PICPA|nr:BA75_02574T0 [Komagataella pastoris]
MSRKGRSKHSKTSADSFLLDDHVGKFPSSRKNLVDISHLVEYSLPHDYTSNNRPPNKRLPRPRRRSDSVHLSNMEYINVNFKFIVNSMGDFRAQALDPNVPLKQSDILRVIISKNDAQCPICLNEEPIAPRMIKCGHVLCFSCLLRFLELDSTKQCPLCASIIKENEVLPVLISQIDNRFDAPRANELLSLYLMHRPSNDVLALPYQLELSDEGGVSGHRPENFPWYSEAYQQFYQYARILKAHPLFSIQCYEKEIELIRINYEEDKLLYNENDIYCQRAIDKIQVLIDEERKSMESSPDDMSSSYDSSYLKLINDTENLQLQDLMVKQYEKEDQSGYFFYQTSFNSKTKFFLSPLDISVIKAIYGDNFSLFPLVLNLKLQDITYETIVPDVLKKHKYLSHLPIGSEIGFLDVEWFEEKGKSFQSILPTQVFQRFKKQLLERAKRTNQRNKREEKNRVKFEKELEQKTLEFYASENNRSLEDYGLTSISARETPTLDSSLIENNDTNICLENAVTTVWGTKIIQSNDNIEEPEVDWHMEPLLQQAREKELQKHLKKRSKKKRNH